MKNIIEAIRFVNLKFAMAMYWLFDRDAYDEFMEIAARDAAEWEQTR